MDTSNSDFIARKVHELSLKNTLFSEYQLEEYESDASDASQIHNYGFQETSRVKARILLIAL